MPDRAVDIPGCDVAAIFESVIQFQQYRPCRLTGGLRAAEGDEIAARDRDDPKAIFNKREVGIELAKQTCEHGVVIEFDSEIVSHRRENLSRLVWSAAKVRPDARGCNGG